MKGPNETGDHDRMHGRFPRGRRMWQRIQGSTFAWRMSGISYRTAVIATKGGYGPPTEYLRWCRQDTLAAVGRTLSKGNAMRVLEFGCGIGGNLIALCNEIREGVGLDVNKGYLRIARRLAEEMGCANLRFWSYDGQNLPGLGTFDLEFSLNVFERVPKERVRRYLRWMAGSLVKGGVMVAFFLSTDARGTAFTRRLGDSAYVFWDRAEAEAAVQESGVQVVERLPWRGVAHLITGRRF